MTTKISKYRGGQFALAVLLIITTTQIAVADERIGELDWHTDYFAAYRAAQREQKLLFIFFRDDSKPHVADAYVNNVLADPQMHDDLSEYVRAILPIDVSVPQADGESPTPLLEHVAFKHMEGRQGVAVVDLVDDQTGQYGKPISAHPFTPGKFYSRRATRVVLQLPRASITQRALIYAIRIHPEAPKSTHCDVDPHLLKETHKHSQVMARIEQVGHHDWGRRFHQLNAHFDNLVVSEVAAVSWGGESLIEGAKDCVHAWRQSSGHWAGVSGEHIFYGYDLVLGASGKWYATGLFASEH